MMADRWQMQVIASYRHESERQKGFGNRQTDRQAFAILESLLQLIIADMLNGSRGGGKVAGRHDG